MPEQQKPETLLPTVCDIPLLTDWTNYLQGLKTTALRALLTYLHDKRKLIFKPFYPDNMPPIEELVNTVATENSLSLDYFKGYTNTYSKAVLPKPGSREDKPIPHLKEVTIEAILYIYCRYGQVTINKDTHEVTVKDTSISFTIDSTPDDTQPTTVLASNLSYLFYYWKSDNRYESDEQVGSYWLDIDYQQEIVTLIHHNGVKFEGKVAKTPAIHDGWMISLVLSRKDLDHKLVPGQTFSIFYHISNIMAPAEHFWATYAKERNLIPGGVGLGTAYVTRCLPSENWQKIEAPPLIRYQLRKNRLDLPQSGSLDNQGEASYLSSQLKKYTGIYEGFLIRLATSGDTSSLNSFYLALREDGAAILYTANEHSFPQSVYAGSFRVIHKQGYSFLVIDYDFNKKDKDQPEFMHFRFILRENTVRHQDTTRNCLLGTRIGAPYGDRPHPISSKVCLLKLTTELQTSDSEKQSRLNQLVNVFFNPPTHVNEDEQSKSPESVVFRELLTKLQSIHISGLQADERHVVEFFKEHDYLKNFLLDKEYQSYTGRHCINLIEELLPVAVPAGDYECYSFTLKENKPILEYREVQSTAYIKYPVRIKPNGIALIKIMKEVHQGNAVYNVGRKELLITIFRNSRNEGETNLMSCLFNIPESQEGNAELPDRLPGVMVKSLKGINLSEGRVCFLQKTTLSFDLNRYDNSISFDSLAFRRMDRDLSGLLSMLSGPNNRIARSYPDFNSITPRSEANSFKRDLFYSACYLSTQEVSDKEIKKRLFQAYIHGFAQTHFQGKKLDNFEQERFYDDLEFERQELNKAIQKGGALHQRPALYKYVKEMWFKSTQKADFQRLLSLGEQQEVYTITPLEHEQMPYASDERAEGYIQELFDYLGLMVHTNKHDSELESLPESAYRICIGLLSNSMFRGLNSQTDPRKNGIYFKLEQGEQPRQTDIKILNSLRRRPFGDDRDWIIFSNGEKSDTDYALLAKVNYGHRKALVLGGIRAIGTELLAEYVAMNWEELLTLKDLETSVTLEKSSNFVCLFSISTDGVRCEVVKASK